MTVLWEMDDESGYYIQIERDDGFDEPIYDISIQVPLVEGLRTIHLLESEFMEMVSTLHIESERVTERERGEDE